MEPDISEIFSSFVNYLKKDQELKEEIKDIVKNIDQAGREVITVLQVIHKNGSQSEIMCCCKKAREIIDTEVKTGFQKLSSLFKPKAVSEYYRYHDSWKFCSQKMAFIISLIVYLESKKLVTHEDVAENLGIHLEQKEGFHLDLEDYLIGLLQLPSELTRLAVNSVVNGDYKRPIEISEFVAGLHAGFRLLNLKNDVLRKRFDALKYDVKKIEEVVYDLSIRGLKPSEVAEPQSVE